MIRVTLLAVIACSWAPFPDAWSQEASVNPGINDSFQNPDVAEFVDRFEIESREVYARRQEIVAACQIKPGQTVADVGAGTGLFTRMFSEAVGKDGRVIAVDIAPQFLEHIRATSREADQRNVDVLLATADSTELPAKSIDVAFICDTYHHFEYPQKTMESIQRALRPGGRVVLVDFRRIPGTSTDWVLNHVRAGQDVFESEIVNAGFKKVKEAPDLLEENYFVVFEKAPADESSARPRGRGRGRGAGRGRGPGPALRADQEVFHFLLDRHAEISRTVKQLDNGVETLTESDQPEIAAKIQEHVIAMHRRTKTGDGLRYWDPLFAAVFQQHARITMSVEHTDKGVRVRETSEDPAVVALIQAHAEVLAKFVAHGYEEAGKSHPVPPAATSKPLPNAATPTK